MSMQDIQEYKEFENTLRDSLESQFNYYITIGKVKEAHDVLLSLMSYRLIPIDDPRCSVKTKLFKQEVNVKEPSNWGVLDYRRPDTLGFMPKYLFCELWLGKTFEVTVLEHWGKRVEGNYSGDIKIGQSKMKIRMSLMNTNKRASDAAEDIAKLINSNGPKVSLEQTKLEATVGVTRIYSIDVVGNVISKYRNLGYVMVKMGDEGAMSAKMLLRYEAAYESWLSISELHTQVESSIRHCVKKEVQISEISTEVTGLCSFKEAMKIQSDKVKDSKDRDEYRLKLEARAEAKAKGTVID